MKISTKVEFGIIALIDIAMHSENDNAVTVYSISNRHNISGKYLEQILTVLRQANFIKGLKGSKGGYVIARPTSEITFKDIINALDLSVLSDVDFSDSLGDSEIAGTLNEQLWNVMTSNLQKFAESISLADIVEQCQKSDEQIMYYI